MANDLFAIEKIYANGIEPLFKRIYEMLISKHVFSITQLQRAEILIAIFQFYIRNPVYYKAVIKFHQSKVNRLWREAKEKGQKGMSYLDQDFSFRDWTQGEIEKHFDREITKQFKERHINDLGDLSQFHERAIVEVNYVKDESEFVTSDNPLIFEDRVTDNEHAFEKSKEFIIALNRKVALRLYHDNRKRTDIIYRCYLPNGSVGHINKKIIDQSVRFVIAKDIVYNKQLEFEEKFLNNTSLELKIDLIRQALEKFPETSENKEMQSIFRYYLDKYERKGTLTDIEEFELVNKVKELGKQFVKTIIK